MVSKLGRMADEILWMFFSGLGGAPQAYCDLETAEPPDLMVAGDGGLATALRIGGVREVQGEQSFAEVTARLAADLSPVLSQRGHAIQVSYYWDPEGMEGKVRASMGEAFDTASRLDLDLGDLLEETARVLAAHTADEALDLVLWTRPSALVPRQRKEAQKRAAALAAANVPGGKGGSYGGQRWLGALPALRNRHRAFVASIKAAFDSAGYDVSEMPAHEALRQTRAALYPDHTAATWRPRLPGDRLTFEMPEPVTSDPGALLWPPLAGQLCPYGGERLRGELVRLGGRVWAPVVVSLAPAAPRPFQALLARVMEAGEEAEIPWRISFFLEGEGLALMSFNAMLARLLWWEPLSADNRNLAAARDMLRQLRDERHEAISALRMVLATWADDEALARRRQAALVRAVQNWGGCETEQAGDALGALLAVAPAFRLSSPAPAAVLPVSEAVSLLPLTRPASPWRQGSMLLRTPDGKLWPYDVRSSKQTAHVVLGNAPMRMGKSVFSNMRLMSLVLHGKNEQLPRIGIIDVGLSSSGLISLLKGALGPERAHLAAFYRIVMDPERYAVNPFDLPVGCRWPTPAHMTFLENFVSLLLTPLDAPAPPEGLPGMARVAIEYIYRLGIDRPKAYAKGVSARIDELIGKADLRIDQHTTWWEIVDQFAGRGMEHEAVRAQRYAVPTLQDLAAVANDQHVAKMYQGEITRGETRAQYFWRAVTEAVQRYPILGRPTVFDLGSARIVSLDLMDVSQQGSELARRQTAVMYMLARYLVAGDFYVAPEHYEALTREQLPDQYRRRHIENARRLKEEIKELVFDEFHRTRGQQACRDQIVIDIREGPKHNVGVALFSQMADDFDEAMRSLETTVVNFGAAAAREIDRVLADYGLPEALRAIMRLRMRKPSASGSHVALRVKTAAGDYTHHLMATAGPRLLWALSTTPADMALRSRLYEALGAEDARTALANRFPKGTAEDEIERMIERRRSEAGTFSEEERQHIIDGLAGEISAAWQRGELRDGPRRPRRRGSEKSAPEPAPSN